MRNRLREATRRLAWVALLTEAALTLLVARALLRVVPFARLTWLFERTPRGPERVGEERDSIRQQVRHAIHIVSPRLPFPMVCFPRAIAAQTMLRRRRIGTVLFYGAKTSPDKGIEAHVWVMDGDHPVTGRNAAAGHSVLARYPDFT